MNYEPFSSDPNGIQRLLKALAKHFAHANTEQARLRRQFGASHEAIEQTVRSEGMGTREALAMVVSSLQEDQRMLARRLDGGTAEILEALKVLPVVRDLLQQLNDRLDSLEMGQNSMASVLAYHARIDPRDYEQDEDDPAGLE
jgi:chromosome segregation ATPase